MEKVMRYVSFMLEGRKQCGWVELKDLENTKLNNLLVVIADEFGGARGVVVSRGDFRRVYFESEGLPFIEAVPYYGEYRTYNAIGTGKNPYDCVGKYAYSEDDGLLIYDAKEGKGYYLKGKFGELVIKDWR